MDSIPIRDAAVRLGVSVESLRKRAQRGTVSARKVDGEWFVDLPDGQDGSQDFGQDTSSPAVSALVDQLTFLQRELERRNLEIERLTGMLAESQRAVRYLLPASTGQGADTKAESPPSDTQTPQRGTERVIDPSARDEGKESSKRRGWLARFFFGDE